MFREIRGVQQRRTDGARKRWFQDPYFDLFLVQDLLGRLQWFQLCYLRDTRRERVLEWKRGRGFLHMRIEQPDYAADRNSGALAPDGAMPYTDVQERFAAASAALPSAVATFVANKVREYARA